jgi:DNA-binding NarL/FixJ family response regulator
MPEEVEVGERGRARALSLARRERWDIALLDIAMPNGNGLDLKQLKREQPALPVLILSMYPEEQYALRVPGNALGYLTRERDRSAGRGSQAARRGQRLRVQIVSHLVGALAVSTTKPRRRASRIANSRSCADRAWRRRQAASPKLCISVSTVGTYRARLLRKWAAANGELIAYAVQHGLAVALPRSSSAAARAGARSC